MEYQLSEVTRYAVNCESCDAGTGNHGQPETAHKAARQKGFIAIVTPEAGTINLCPKCVPPAVAVFYRNDVEPEPDAKAAPKPEAVKDDPEPDDEGQDDLPLGPRDEEEEA